MSLDEVSAAVVIAAFVDRDKLRAELAETRARLAAAQAQLDAIRSGHQAAEFAVAELEREAAG